MVADMNENSIEIKTVQDAGNSDNNKQFPTWKCVTDYFSYITPTARPLSANVSVIESGKYLWVYDVGSHENIPEMLSEVSKQKSKKIKVILSHFHPDHIANLQYIKWESLYQGKNTYKYTHIGEIVESEINVDEPDIKLRIFPMPSSHAKGSLAFMVNDKYCLLGDALYPTHKGNKTVYNTGFLKEQIDILKNIAAPYVLISHREPFVQKKQAVITWLENVYSMREKNEPWIELKGL
ncbi:MBL fold metallo-hydrolase [Eubacterium sp. MSJ-13]|uniref:MBL fold metallo-hydrolase n=1 Tax=Eubacterium sp. MSJ-13 TaxID=2841513 RepID=UPI001C10189C|nr:MBL fold metallo-hydrolase [Eubacterium sp. MSJ-13]MBU5478151.1 MBL fold metallo-hydrolase [Eubacterium sp. MSJ-13]